MEVLRPSTPMPYGKSVSNCKHCKNRGKYATTSVLPHLKPLLEEKLAKRAKAGDLVQPFQRCGITSRDEGETVEFFHFSPKANVLRISEKELPKRFAMLPGISNEADEVIGNFECLERIKHNQNKLCGERNAKQELTQLLHNTNSKSSSSLPSLEFGKTTRSHHSTNSTKNSSLQKHIELENRNFDPTTSKEDILQKYFQGQQ